MVCVERQSLIVIESDVQFLYLPGKIKSNSSQRLSSQSQFDLSDISLSLRSLLSLTLMLPCWTVCKFCLCVGLQEVFCQIKYAYNILS